MPWGWWRRSSPPGPHGSPYAYEFQVANNDTWTNPERVVLPPAAGATRTVVVDGRVLGDLFTGSEWYVRVYAAYVDTAETVTWRSSDYRAWLLHRTIGVNRYSCDRNLTP